MTFTTKIKEEITAIKTNSIDERILLLAYLSFSSYIDDNKITVFIENANVARYIYKLIKSTFNININLTVRTQKKFKIKKVFILSIKEKATNIIEEIYELKNNITMSNNEEIASFLKGVFLFNGSINDPSKSKYHLEFMINDEIDANLINQLLIILKFNSKIIRRDKGYMVYIKSSEEISDFIKLLGAVNSLFYYEDIRIYRDHKNMVNRLNNCEQANIEKSMSSSKEQLDNIKYLKEHDLIDLLDEKLQNVILYKEKYPETTMSELANIISLETEKPITKSGINHYFRKIRDLVNKDKNKGEDNEIR